MGLGKEWWFFVDRNRSGDLRGNQNEDSRDKHPPLSGQCAAAHLFLWGTGLTTDRGTSCSTGKAACGKTCTAKEPLPLIIRYFDSLPVPLPAIMHVRACPIPLTALECILSTINIIIIPVMEAMMK